MSIYMSLNRFITTSDTAAIAATTVIGDVLQAPVGSSIKVQILCFVVTKLVAHLPDMIRAVSAKRRARRAGKNA
jgi:hypothetical protein